ncbi:unnamed protein product [Polarella glacialis]|uniref:Uncharacterized protein n=1 Tax=Polarella glacialis TaxID=89957 RepID=A0A813IE75_POLGL|nr:unnamed protein product [Polarella glacialis]
MSRIDSTGFHDTSSTLSKHGTFRQGGPSCSEHSKELIGFSSLPVRGRAHQKMCVIMASACRLAVSYISLQGHSTESISDMSRIDSTGFHDTSSTLSKHVTFRQGGPSCSEHSKESIGFSSLPVRGRAHQKMCVIMASECRLAVSYISLQGQSTESISDMSRIDSTGFHDTSSTLSKHVTFRQGGPSCSEHSKESIGFSSLPVRGRAHQKMCVIMASACRLAVSYISLKGQSTASMSGVSCFHSTGFHDTSSTFSRLLTSRQGGPSCSEHSKELIGFSSLPVRGRAHQKMCVIMASECRLAVSYISLQGQSTESISDMSRIDSTGFHDTSSTLSKHVTFRQGGPSCSEHSKELIGFSSLPVRGRAHQKMCVIMASECRLAVF